MRRSFLGSMMVLSRRTDRVMGVSEAVGTVLLLGVSVSLAGAVALWTQTIDEGEEGLYVDLWAVIEGNELVITHRGGDILDGYLTNLHVRNQDGSTTVPETTYWSLTGMDFWLPGDSAHIDITASTDVFDIVVTTEKSNGNSVVVMSNTMVKPQSSSNFPDLGLTLISIKDSDGSNVNTIYETGSYVIQVMVKNFGSNLTDVFFAEEAGNKMSNLRLFDTSDPLEFSSIQSVHHMADAPHHEVTGAGKGMLMTGDYMIINFTWSADEENPRSLGSHVMNVKIVPYPGGEVNYRNNYIDKRFNVDKELVPVVIPGPNPGIHDIYFSNNAPHSGDEITVTVVIQNSGDQPINASHGVILVISTWKPELMNTINSAIYGWPVYSDVRNWRVDQDSPPDYSYGDWRTDAADMPITFDDTFPTCIVPDISLLPGAYFFYYFTLTARVEIPGGQQKVYAAIDVYNTAAQSQALKVSDGDQVGNLDNYKEGTVQVLPKILLVDDDEAATGSGLDVTSTVLESIVGAGVTIDNIYIAQSVKDNGTMRDAPAYSYEQDEIAAPALKDYDIVIWVTGYADDPFTNKPKISESDFGGNIQELMEYMDNNKYLLIAGESPYEGLSQYFTGGISLVHSGFGSTNEFQDASLFVYNYLGIARIDSGEDLPYDDPNYLVGIDTEPEGITYTPDPVGDPYHINLEEQTAGNGAMQNFLPRDVVVGTFELPIGVLTTQNDLDTFTGLVNSIKACSSPVGTEQAQYRVVSLAWDITQITYLNEKIELFAGILRWFDWEIHVGRDLAVTKMELSILNFNGIGWENNIIDDENVPKYLDTVQVEATIRNNGPTIETTTVMFYITGPDGIELPITPGIPDPRDPSNDDVNPLDISGVAGGGGEETIFKLWLAVGVGEYTFRVVVDPYHLIEEVSEDNNDISYSTSTVTSFVTQNNILIVDDDDSSDNWDLQVVPPINPIISYPVGEEPSSLIEDILTDFGSEAEEDEYSYKFEVATIINTYDGDWHIGNGPEISELKRYNSILWVTGDSGSIIPVTRQTYTDSDMSGLQDYLNGNYQEADFLPEDHNENVMFIGSRIISDLSADPAAFSFMENYMGVSPGVADSDSTRLIMGPEEGEFNEDVFVGIQYSMTSICEYEAYNLSVSPESDIREGYQAYSDGAWNLIGSHMRKEDHLNKIYFRTIVNSWQMTRANHASVESALYEMVYLSLHWFETPEYRPEILSRNSKLIFENENPVMGNSYVLTFEIANLGGSGGGGTVRFLDGRTLIKSENVYLQPDQVTTLEAIWTPLYAGERHISVSIDYYSDYDEVFDSFNNNPSQTREVYFFWDDMENGTGNWEHDATVVMINGEGRLDYMEEPTNTDIDNTWSGTDGFNLNTAVSNPVVQDIYHTSPNSFMMYEPELVGSYRKPIDMVIIIDTTGSMAGQKLTDAKTAAKTMVNMFNENDRCALFKLTSDGELWIPQFLVEHFTYMTEENKKNFTTTIDSWTASGGTPLWDASGYGIDYSQDPVSYGGTARPGTPVDDYIQSAMVLTDGVDQYYSGTYEAGSRVFCPGSPSGESYATSTWGIAAGNTWGDFQSYSHQGGMYMDVQYYDPVTRTVRWTDLRYHATTQGWDGVAGIGGSDSDKRYGLAEAPPLVYYVGLNITPQSSFSSLPGYMPDWDVRYPFTHEYAMKMIAETSGSDYSGSGQYFFTPDSSELEKIFSRIFLELENEAMGSTRGSGVPTRSDDPWDDGTTALKDKYIVTNAIDLRNADSARLTFYQKYNLRRAANGGVMMVGTWNGVDWDFKYVQPDYPYTGNILVESWDTRKDDYGNVIRWCWNGLSGSGTMDWEFVSVNLDDFTGQIVVIAFYYIYEFGGTGYGWFIDDVKVTLSTDEDNPGKDLSMDAWDLITAPTPGNQSHSGSKAWYCGGSGFTDFKDSLDNSLYTRQIDLTYAKTVKLEAYLKFNIDDTPGRPPDGFRVEISIDGGKAWIPLNLGVRSSWSVSGSEDDISDGFIDNRSYTGLNEGEDWVSTDTMARLITNLDGFTGNVITIRFRMVTNTDGIHYEVASKPKGFFIDDVVIYGESLEGSRGSTDEAPDHLRMPERIESGDAYPATISSRLPEETMSSAPEGSEDDITPVDDDPKIDDAPSTGIDMNFIILMASLIFTAAMVSLVVVRRRS
ncbi:MAG: CARDB domain-containing protein [Thermoplasmatota archaeon]